MAVLGDPPVSLPARLLVLLGPTASGKSALAIHLAGRFDGEVVACDSTQVYRRCDIGTGKVPEPARQGIRHWMIDLIEPEEIFTAGDYRRCAEPVLRDIRARGRLPIVTAGTGLYLRALLEGLSDAPVRCEPLRERLRGTTRTRGPAHLHRLLTRLDRQAAARIAATDTQKVIRAVEICLLARRTVDAVHASERPALQGFEVIKIGLRPPRELLYEAINRRVEEMFAVGWVEEVRRLIDAGAPLDSKPFTFIGYRQIASHILKGVSQQQTITEIQQATRNFAKRQLTWFGRDRNVNWVDSFGADRESEALAEMLLR